MKTILHDLDLSLSTPYRLPGSTELRGGRIRLAVDFQPAGDPLAALVIAGDRCAVEGVRFEGPSFEWWRERRLFPFRALAVVNAARTRIESCRFERWSAEAILTRDFFILEIFDCEARDCNAALGLDWPRASGNRALVLDGLTALDTWALPGQNAIGESILRRGESVGANFVYGSGIISGRFQRLVALGEGKGVKLTQSVGVTLERIRVPELWLGGVSAVPAGWIGPTTSSGYVLRDSVIGESTWGYSLAKTADPKTFHAVGAISDPIQVERTVFLAPRPGPFFAPWWGDQPAPDWTRQPMIEVRDGARVRLSEGCRFLDLHGDQPEPIWTQVEAGSELVEDPAVPRERYTPHWTAP